MSSSYPNPNHGALSRFSSSSVRDAGSMGVSMSGIGGCRPATWTVDIKPCFCIARHRDRCIFVIGIDVRDNRARDAFWRCEHTCARLTKTMVDGEVEGSEESDVKVVSARGATAGKQ